MLYNLKEITNVLESSKDGIIVLSGEFIVKLIPEYNDKDLRDLFTANLGKVKNVVVDKQPIVTPTDVYNLMLTRIRLDSSRINNYIYPKMKLEFTKLSNSEKLTLVKKNILDNKNLPSVSVIGYNYTNLDRTMTIGNCFIILIDYIDEITMKVIEIANNNDFSTSEKLYRLDELKESIEDNANKLVDFPILIDNKELPNYYRNDAENKEEIIIDNYNPIYTRLRTCKSKALIMKKYGSEYTFYINKLARIITRKEINDIYKKYGFASDIGKKITSVYVTEGKLINSFTDILITMIACQVNETIASLQQDIQVINSLVSEYRKESN